MKTVADLGKEKKEQYPNSDYANFSDEELGRKFKARYPDKYRDYIDPADVPKENTSLQKTQKAEIAKDPRAELVGEELLAKVTALESFYDPYKGIFSNWLGRIKAESGGRFVAALSQTQLLVIQQAALLENEVANRRKSQAEYQVFLAQHHVILTELRQKEHLIDNALGAGLSTDVHQEILKTKALDELEVNKQKTLVQIDIDRQRDEAEIEMNKVIKMMEAEIRMGIIAQTLTAQQQLFLTQELLDKVYWQIEEIESGRFSDSTKMRMIADREEMVLKLKSGKMFSDEEA